MSIRREFTTYATDMEIKVIAHISPPVAPTIRMDPNDSDPGDPGERYVEAVMIFDRKAKKYIDITDCFTGRELDALADEAYDDWKEGE